MVMTGLEVLAAQIPEHMRGKKIGLVTNHGSVNSKLDSAADILSKCPDVELTMLFSPEHGLRGDAQAGVHIQSYIDKKTGLPVHSLYGKAIKPSKDLLAGIEILVFDLQGVSCRFWTYLSTMSYCIEAAGKYGLPFIVLDRPNPIGGTSIEGNILNPEFTSMVGCHPLPIRTGLTMGEAALMLNTERKYGANLHIIKAEGWHRSMWFDEIGLPFVPPSPNMPTLDTMTLYPGTCLVEGTNLSEGRGTTKPFELIGAPWLDAELLAGSLNDLELSGVRFRPAYFTPSFSKHSGTLCKGVQVHAVSRKDVRAVEVGLHIIDMARRQSPQYFAWAGAEPHRETPLFFDLLAGGTELREQLESGTSIDSIISGWSGNLNAFDEKRKTYLLYD